MTGRAGDGQAEDFADVADAAPALDLLLSDAALGIMRRTLGRDLTPLGTNSAAIFSRARF